MSEQQPYLAAPYSALAAVYDRAGYSQASADAVPHYLAYAYALDWAGRRVVDVGCGTGLTSLWLANQGYRVVGVDASPHMLAQAEQNAAETELIGDAPDFVPMDVRRLESPMGEVDLVLAIGGVLNALQSLREMEAAFRQVNQVLDTGRLFIFDLHTIYGLAHDMPHTDRIDFDNGQDLSVIVRRAFSFETLAATHHYWIWQRDENGWQRQEEIHIERGFPTQAVLGLLERTGFRTVAVLDPGLEPFDARQDAAHERAIFMAQKTG